MPKGRGSQARRRTKRQHGHLYDDRHPDRSEAMARGALKLQALYERAAEVAEKRRSKK